MQTDSAASLDALAARWGVELSAAQTAALTAFMGQLLQWNKAINLTGAHSEAELLEEHLPDSFALASVIPAGARGIDVGAGGGLPGIPFSILRPDCEVTLLEPRGRRASFLRTAVRLAGDRRAKVRIDEQRLEAFAAGRGAFQAAWSRATFPPDEWLEVGAALLEPRGMLVAFLTRGQRLSHPLAAGGRRIAYGDRDLLVVERST